MTPDAIAALGESIFNSVTTTEDDIREFINRVERGFKQISDADRRESFERLVKTLVYNGGNVSFRKTDSIEPGTWLCGESGTVNVEPIFYLTISNSDVVMPIRLDRDSLNLLIQDLQKAHDFMKFEETCIAE